MFDPGFDDKETCGKNKHIFHVFKQFEAMLNCYFNTEQYSTANVYNFLSNGLNPLTITFFIYYTLITYNYLQKYLSCQAKNIKTWCALRLLLIEHVFVEFTTLTLTL